MLKKTITYKDLDGNPVTEDFYFNLSKAEIAELELGHEGGFSAYLEKIVTADDGGEIISAFKNILTLAIGERSEDGRRFIKSEEIVNNFIQSDAYSELFMELVTDANAATAFVQGIVPQDMAQEVAAIDVSDQGGPEDKRPAYIRENRDPTKAELQSMSREELQEAFAFKALRAAE